MQRAKLTKWQLVRISYKFKKKGKEKLKKLHFVITGKTAAEIIQNRVNSQKNKMGLTSWRRSPKGKIMPSDISIAKNYLDKKELTELNRIVNMYLDYAEMGSKKGSICFLCLIYTEI